MATPLKIKDNDGNIQELTSADENYVAYQIGLHLSVGDSAEVGSLNRITQGTNIGAFSNTFFNEAVGTHPSTAISTGTTTTTLYQTTGTAAETDSDTFSPLMWQDSASTTGFQQMPTADLNAAVDSYLTKIFTNEYPGSYRLAVSAPSSDWTAQQTAFTDTRTDGTSVVSKFWKRTGGTEPTAAVPIYVSDSAGGSGIKLTGMTERKIKFSFGQRAKTRIMASGIGTHQLRSATDGAPTATGTWVARGTATDTKQQTAQQNFTRDSTSNFQQNYTRLYTSNYATNYTKIYQITYQNQYTSNYTKSYTQAYQNEFSLTNYTASYATTFTAPYQKEFDAGYESTQYLLTFAGTYDPNYIRNFVGNFASGFAGTAFNTGFAGSAYQGTYTGNYVPNYLRNFANTFQGAFVGPTYNRNYTRNYTSNYVRNYTGNFARAFSSSPVNYVPNFVNTVFVGVEAAFVNAARGSGQGGPGSVSVADIERGLGGYVNASGSTGQPGGSVNYVGLLYYRGRGRSAYFAGHHFYLNTYTGRLGQPDFGNSDAAHGVMAYLRMYLGTKPFSGQQVQYGAIAIGTPYSGATYTGGYPFQSVWSYAATIGTLIPGWWSGPATGTTPAAVGIVITAPFQSSSNSTVVGGAYVGPTYPPWGTNVFTSLMSMGGGLAVEAGPLHSGPQNGIPLSAMSNTGTGRVDLLGIYENAAITTLVAPTAGGYVMLQQRYYVGAAQARYNLNYSPTGSVVPYRSEWWYFRSYTTTINLTVPISTQNEYYQSWSGTGVFEGVGTTTNEPGQTSPYIGGPGQSFVASYQGPGSVEAGNPGWSGAITNGWAGSIYTGMHPPGETAAQSLGGYLATDTPSVMLGAANKGVHASWHVLQVYAHVDETTNSGYADQLNMWAMERSAWWVGAPALQEHLRPEYYMELGSGYPGSWDARATNMGGSRVSPGTILTGSAMHGGALPNTAHGFTTQIRPAAIMLGFYDGSGVGVEGAAFVGPGGSYVRNYTRNDTVDFVRNDTASFVTGYVPNYVRNFDNTFVGGFQGTAIAEVYQQSDYVPNYIRAYTPNYIRNYTRNVDTGYQGAGIVEYYDKQNYTANYVNTYTSNYVTAYTGAYDTAYLATYTSNYEIVYDTSYQNEFVGDYTADYGTGYERVYTKEFQAQYLTDYLGNYEGNFEGLTIQSSSETNETYTLYVRIS